MLRSSDVTTFPSNVPGVLLLRWCIGSIVSDTRRANVCLREPLLRLNQSFAGLIGSTDPENGFPQLEEMIVSNHLTGNTWEGMHRDFTHNYRRE